MLLFNSKTKFNPAKRVLIRTIALSVILRVYTILVCSPFREFFNYWHEKCESLGYANIARTPYHHETLILINNDEFCRAKNVSPILWALVVPFISFDGDRYLKLAMDNITCNFEHNCPFFLGLPTIIRIAGNVFEILYSTFVSPDVPPRIISMAVGGIIVNNIAFVLASLVLYYVVLNYDSGKYKNSAEEAAFWFALNPSSIHSNSLYTEPLFSLSVNLSTLLLIKSESHHVMLKYIWEFIAILLLAFSCTLRSNGIFYLAPLFFYKLRNWKYLDHFYNLNFGVIILIKSILYWGISLVEAIIVMVPFVLNEVKLYNSFCGVYSGIQDQNPLIRPWCKYSLPISYTFIQKEYWDVSFLWVLKKPDRITRLGYALPVYLPAIDFIKSKLKYTKLEFNLLKSHEIGYMISFIVTFITFLLYAHCEVFMRQTLSHHIFYIHLATIFKSDTGKSSIFKKFFVLYFFIGATLFGMRIGWT